MTDTRDLLKDVYDRVGDSVPAVLEGLTPDEAAWRPEGRGNSIGWLVWHLTRVLDDHLASAAGVDQVIETEGWADRLGLDRAPTDTGYGDDEAQVAATRFADLAVLAAYHAEVQEMAAAQLDHFEDLDLVVDEQWDPPVTLAVRLVSVGDDMARHLGQAEYVKGLLGAR